MNRQKELAKNTIILTMGKICTQFVSFLLLPLYTALLVPEEFGIIDLFNTYITLLTPIFNWQFENGLFRFLIDFRNDKEKQKALFSTVFITNIIQCGIYGLFFLAFQGFISSEYKVFLVYDVMANIIMNTLLQFPRGLGKNGVYSIGSFVSASSTVVLNVLFIAVFKWGAYGMFVATLSAKAITIVYLFVVMKTWQYFSLSAVDKNLFKSVTRYSFPLIPNQLSWWVVGASDRTIVSNFLSVAINGIYSVANKFSTVFVTFYNLFNLAWTESVSLHMDDKDRDDFLTDMINTMFNLFVAVDIGIIACMPFAFGIMVNSQYADAYYQIPILLIAAIFQVVVGLFSVIYVALKKSSEIAKTSLLAAIINIVVDLALIKFIGLYAASVSTLVAYASMGIYRYFDIRKYVKVRLRKRNVVLATLIGSLTLVTYYLRNYILCAISLLVVVIYAVLVNKKMLMSSIKAIIVKLHRK